MNQELELLKEQVVLLEKLIRTIDSKATNNTNNIDEVINKIDREHELINEKLSKITNTITQIESELTDVKKNLSNLITSVNEINNFIEKDVRPEIEALKGFDEEIVA